MSSRPVEMRNSVFRSLRSFHILCRSTTRTISVWYLCYCLRAFSCHLCVVRLELCRTALRTVRSLLWLILSLTWSSLLRTRYLVTAIGSRSHYAFGCAFGGVTELARTSLLHHFDQGVEQVCSTASGTIAISSQWSSLLAAVVLHLLISR